VLKHTVTLFAIVILLLAVVPAEAQSWRFSTALYLWGAGMDGEVGAIRGGVDRIVEVDQSFGDILSNLELGFMGAVRGENETWSVTGDLIYMGLGKSVDGPLGNPIDVDVDMTVIGGDVGYKVSETAELLAGGRIVNLGSKLHFFGPLNLEIEDDRTWFDPYFGIRFTPWLSENWSFLGRFDFGGFDIGSDFTWHLNAAVLWHVTEKSSLAFGYRVLDTKYDDEEGEDEFVFDMTFHGPIVGFIYSF
jgi:hypothetical protein